MQEPPSITDPLVGNGWTSLKIRWDENAGDFLLLALREWEIERVFTSYGSVFDHESTLARPNTYLEGDAVRDLYRACDRDGELTSLLDRLREERHQGLDVWVHEPRDIRFFNNIHSSTLGVGNKRHATRGGGIRRHGFDHSEEEVLIDGMNLSRGMSYKNAAAGIPYGGCKLCVHANPIELDDLEALGFLAWCIDRSRAFTGPDMGMLPEHADVLRKHFTKNIVGGSDGALGPTGGPTAHGVFLALREAARHRWGSDEFTERTVALQGLGAVGGPLGRELLAAGVRRLTVSDPSEERRDAFRASLPADQATRVTEAAVDEILFIDADIVSPNAIGAVLGEAEIERLRCRLVMGAANNQLRATTREEEIALSDRLAAREILYQIDWMHNGAGVLAGAEEYENQEEASLENLGRRLEAVCGAGVRANLAEAAQRGLTPTRLAYERTEAAIHGQHS